MPDPDPNPNPQPAGEGGGAPPPNDAAKLEAKNRELLAERKKDAAKMKDLETQVAGFNELKGKFDKLTEIAKALGAPDPNAQDPEKVKAQLEAEARAKREKSDKVNDALTLSLLGTGRKLTPDAVRLIRRGAEDHPAIGFDDTGKVTGVESYLESVFGLFGGGEPSGDKKTSPPPPGKPGAGGGGPALPDKFKNAKSLLELSVADQMELASKYPERYGELVSVVRAQLANPVAMPLVQPKR